MGVIAGHRPGRTTRAPTTLNLNFVEDARARPSNGVAVGTAGAKAIANITNAATEIVMAICLSMANNPMSEGVFLGDV